jgi:signal transduction histidine kinase
LNKDKPKDELMKYINTISFENEKISTISSFVTKADFNLKATEIETDLVKFIEDYIHIMYGKVEALINTKDLKILFINKRNTIVIKKIRPLEITMMIDNFINNSIKAEATKLEFIIKKNKEFLMIDIVDNGIGINDENRDKIFDFGFTTTKGSGIGLYHISEIIKNLNGTISLGEEKKQIGVEFNIRINL